MLRLSPLMVLVAAVPASARAQDRPPALEAIRERDLRADIDVLAADAMRGREAGTLDELRASAWLAQRAAEIGLAPAGDDGTYFQFWPLRRVRVAATSRVILNGAVLRLNREAFVVRPVNAHVAGTVVWVGGQGAGDLASRDLRGEVIAADLLAPARLPDPEVGLWGYRYTLAALRDRATALASAGAAAIVLVSDSIAETEIGFVGVRSFQRGRFGLDAPEAGTVDGGPPVLWVSRAWRDRLTAADGGAFEADLRAESFVYPSVNVVAVVRGTDTELRDEFVLFSGHQDHDGILPAVDGDSIWNGADDNASVSVALLAIGRAFVRSPGRRSALFVWHGAEEKGLLGSRWHAAHPVVPADAIVAVLNADMIGRNHPDSAALLGVQPPHLNSPDLAAWALQANERFIGFALDTLWDRPDHVEGWYFRSDHVPYARLGIPAVYFSSLPHPDYHTPRDEPAAIDAAKLARMARWMYATGWWATMRTAVPARLEAFRLER